MLCGLALSAGNEPTIPALHWAITSSGPETINKGAPTTGNLNFPSNYGTRVINKSPKIFLSIIIINLIIETFFFK